MCLITSRHRVFVFLRLHYYDILIGSGLRKSQSQFGPNVSKAEQFSVSILIEIFYIGQNGLALNKTKPVLILRLMGDPVPFLL